MSTLAQQLVTSAKQTLLGNETVIRLFEQIKSATIEKITSNKCVWTHRFKYVTVEIKVPLTEPVINQSAYGEAHYEISEIYRTMLDEYFHKDGFLPINLFLMGRILETIELEIM
jgi:hypothetical protein